MDVFEAIARRHSYRGPFEGRPVPREDLRRIVEAGLAAPSGRNEQTTCFIIVDDPAVLGRIHALHGRGQAAQQPPAMILCLVDEEPDRGPGGIDYAVEDCAVAVENMLLATTALGYATVWVDARLDDVITADEVGALLHIPEDKTIRVVLPIGIPREVRGPRAKRGFGQRAWFNCYGGDA